MSELKREALAVLAEVCEFSPEVRLGQLFAHLGFLGESLVEKGLGTIEDDELVAILYRHRTELCARSDNPSGIAHATVSANSLSGSVLPQHVTASS